MAGSVLCISDEQAAWEAEIAGSSRELQGIRAGRLDRGAKPDGRPGAAAQREAVHWLGSRATGCAFLQPVVADPPGALLKSP